MYCVSYFSFSRFPLTSFPSKLRVTGLCEGNPPVTGGFPSQTASNAENVSIWWHRGKLKLHEIHKQSYGSMRRSLITVMSNYGNNYPCQTMETIIHVKLWKQLSVSNYENNYPCQTMETIIRVKLWKQLSMSNYGNHYPCQTMDTITHALNFQLNLWKS